MYLSDGKNYHYIEGNLVEHDALMIAEAINAYDPDLFLICLNPDSPDVNITDAPFVVIWRNPQGVFEKVLEAWQLDQRIIERIWLADYRHNNQLQQLEDLEAAIRKENERKRREHIEEKTDIAVSVLATPKSSYTFKRGDDLVKVNEHGPQEINSNKRSFNVGI